MPVNFRLMVLKENLPRCKISEGVTKVVHTSLEVFFGLTSWAKMIQLVFRLKRLLEFYATKNVKKPLKCFCELINQLRVTKHLFVACMPTNKTIMMKTIIQRQRAYTNLNWRLFARSRLVFKVKGPEIFFWGKVPHIYLKERARELSVYRFVYK